MSDVDLLRTTLAQVLGEERGDARSVWRAFDEGGFSRISVPATAGGSDGTIEQAHAVFDCAGYFAAPIPTLENVLAGWLCARAGLTLPAGGATVAPARPDTSLSLTRGADGWLITGVAERVPWAHAVDHIVGAVPHGGATAVVVVPAGALSVDRHENLAGEPRDTVTFDAVEVADASVGIVDLPPDQTLLWGAMARAVQTAGAARRALDLTRRHVLDRVQFGRSLASFQHVRMRVAELAAEVAVADAAAEAAMVQTGGNPGVVEVAAAKVRTARAARLVAAIAHQLHGAMGFTDEHPLHTCSTRLWSWRDEYGSERWWAERLGRLVVTAGAQTTWEALTCTTSPE